MFEPEFWGPIIDDFQSAYDAAAVTKAHLEEAHRDHQDTGALRSSQGTTLDMHERLRLFEELDRLEDAEESKEIVMDATL